MWQADPAQRARIETLAQAFIKELPSFWIEQSGYKEWKFLYDDARLKLIDQLTARFGGEFLGQAMPDFLMFPDGHELPKYYCEENEKLNSIARLAFDTATKWLAEHGDGYAIKLISDRLQYLLLHLEQDPFVCQPALRKIYGSGNYMHSPHIQDCVKLLVCLRHHPEALEPLEHLVLGHWNSTVTLPAESGVSPLTTTRYNIPNFEVSKSLEKYRSSELNKSIAGVLESLYAAGRLDYERLLLVYQNLPTLIPFDLLFWCSKEQLATLSVSQRALYEDIQKLGWSFIQEWDKKKLGRLDSYILRYNDGKCYGSRYLLAALDRVQKLGVSAINAHKNTAPWNILRKLAGAEILGNEDTEQILAKLQGFSKQSLLALLPFNHSSGRTLMMQALGWQSLEPLINWIISLSERRTSMVDPESYNIINRLPEFEAKLVGLDMTSVKELLEVYRNASQLTNTLTLFEAKLGFNTEQLQASIAKHIQFPISVYGLVPLERGEEETLERYLLFKKTAKESTKYGAERQGNIRAAVQEGLIHLAKTAGYPDLARLEWAMESRLSDKGPVLGSRTPIGDWEVELNLNGLEAELSIFKQDKPLKSVPVGIRKLEGFLAFKDAQAQIKAQVSRFRAALENMMVDGETLNTDDLSNLRQLPVVSRLLQRLILRAEDGHYGFLDIKEPCLLGVDGKKTLISGAVLIAHPYHFFQDGVLSDWQREVVQKRIVQPFKQAFRELYVLTPAEEQTSEFSNRFADHALKPTIACSLLQTRNWKFSGSDYTEAKKVFRKADLTAEFIFPDADDDYLARMELVTSDQLRFKVKDQSVNLKEVPPLIFSEVMRDADLVVSVAQLDEQDSHWSTESYQRRAELVTALLNDMGLSTVRCEGHFAYVTGSLANYRVHLGSAAIHIEPGNYLCIVPEKTDNKRDKIFLPFADADSKTSEIISKILMLANDKRIKDNSILSQIRKAKPQ
ncbi:MAG: DUF4132 domain-containing protein [Methylobacter sp.]|nr:DUF4132 domain-containing protein [Methylobacter sp.]